MTELFITPEQGRNRLQEMREKVSQSRNTPRAKGAVKHATMQATQAPQAVSLTPENPILVSIENTATDEVIENTVSPVSIPVPEVDETAEDPTVKPRRKRRTKAQMQEAREREMALALNPALVSIETTDSTVIINNAGAITFHNDHAGESLTEEETPDPESLELASFKRDPDALLPESIAYLVNKVLKGRQLCREDREALEAEARKHRMGLLPFVYKHAKVNREFAALIESARDSLSLNTYQGGEDAWFDLNTAVALTQEYPFLCSDANITLLDSVMFEAPVVPRRIGLWRSQMSKTVGFDFRSIDSQRPEQPDDAIDDTEFN
jgi:hypothetical protein